MTLAPHTFSHDGKTLTALEWAKELGIERITFYRRVQKCLPPEKLFAVGYLSSIQPNSRRMLTYQGKTMAVRDWANHLGVRYHTFVSRLYRNMPLDVAMTPGRLAKRRTGTLFTYNGKTQSMAAWGRDLGLTRERVRQRIKKHGVEYALSGRRDKPRVFTTKPCGRAARLYAGKTVAQWVEETNLARGTIQVLFRHNPESQAVHLIARAAERKAARMQRKAKEEKP